MTGVQPAASVLFAAALAASACGGPASPGTGGLSTPPAGTPSATVAAASPSPSPTPRPSPLTSTKGSITVREPVSGQAVSSGGFTLSGDASVFEANVQYRLVTSAGTVLAQGHTTATAGAPQKGTFTVEVRFDPPYYGEAGFVEVFERSAKDGTISDIVRVPVMIVGSY